MKKSIVVSGMQPSGQLHLGNYLGALKNWVDIQNSGEHDCFFFIADYHSITEDYNPKDKEKQILNLVCDYLSAGLDPDKSIIFLQSQVPECTELAWIFNTVTPIAELERMTQFKDKSAKQTKNINLGLFDYPVLQAADILIYHGNSVPVGQDQVQHVELTRDIARWFNNKYGKKYFPEAQPLLTPTPKVMSLVSPENKMSKSAGDKHWIGIDEEPKIIIQKIAKAASTPAGVENLKGLYQAFKDSMPGKFDETKMAETKKIIGQGIADSFAPFRQAKAKLIKDKNYIKQILKQGQEKAQPIARQTLKDVKEIIGLEI